MSSYSNYQKAKEIIENRRLSSIARAEMRDEEVRERSAVIAEIDKELTGTGLLLFKTACAGGDIEPIKKRNLELVAKRKKELVKMGLPEDYTELKYHCPKCSDSGFIDTRMCSCLRELIVTMNIKSSGMGHLIERQSFDNFDLDWYASDPNAYELMSRNLATAKKFAEQFGK